jgi:hypothetical protein
MSLSLILALLLSNGGAAPAASNVSAPFSPSAALSRIVLEDVVFEDGDVISGTISSRHITIPTGVTVYADGDLHLNATRSLTISGSLIAQDASTIPGAVDGPAITIQSAGRLTVFGFVTGGDGRSYGTGDPEGTDGGAGSEILMDCPDFMVTGEIRGGNGGHGAPGGDGGDGGTVTALGTTRTAHGLRPADYAGLEDHFGVIAGNGGPGGDGTLTIDPGNGGAGGGVISALTATATLVDDDPVVDPVPFCPRNGPAAGEIFAVLGPDPASRPDT